MVNNRPLSPHLQIYKLPITGLISITHRMTGVFLIIGLIGILWLIAQVKTGMLDYLTMQTWLQTPLIKLILSGFIYALVFHLCHGVRHLLWDFGHSFSRENLTRYAQIELSVSLILTAIILAVLL